MALVTAPVQLPPVSRRIATELGAGEGQVRSAIELLDGGATVPFVARYRKEATGGLDDAQLRLLDERLGYLRELEERRTAVIASVTEQGKLTDELHAQLLSAETKSRLEDVYLPFKPKRRTKAMIAREAGLEPLASAADLPGYDIGGWNGLMTTAGTPAPIIDRLLAEVTDGLATPELRERFSALGMEVGVLGPEAFRTMLRAQWELFGGLIRQLGIRAE